MKLFFTITGFLVLLLPYRSIFGSSESISSKFEEASIVPDILDEGPISELEVEYDTTKLIPGQELTPSEAKKSPQTIKWIADEGKTYTFVFLDPDATSRAKPIYRSFLHGLIVNIPGSTLGRGNVVAQYKGPGPPKGTGLHRYVFLVFEQTQKIETPEIISSPARSKFSMRDFIRKHRLTPRPVAGNFIEAQFTN